MLKDHGEAHDDADHDTEHATGADQDEGFVEVQHLDAALGEAHGSHDTYFFGLVHQVGAHAGAKGEEAQEHRDGDDDVEDYIQDLLDFLICFVILEVISDLNAFQLFGS